MNKRPGLYVALMMLAASVAVEAGTAAGAPGQASRSPAAPAPGLAIINRSCTSCHDSGQIMQARPTADWPPIIERMRANGAVISDADAKVLLDYLGKNYSVHR